jgi:hypothetical protein
VDLAAAVARVVDLRRRSRPLAGGYEHIDVTATNEFYGLDASALAQAEALFETDLRALLNALRSQWGESTHVELAGVLFSPQPASTTGVPPLQVLSDFMDEIEVWRLADRWIGVGIGQLDPDAPLRIVAAVGCVSDLPT